MYLIICNRIIFFIFQYSSQSITTVNESIAEPPGTKEDLTEITNLTAEIESFVRIADTDKAKLRDTPEKSFVTSAATTTTKTPQKRSEDISLEIRENSERPPTTKEQKQNPVNTVKVEL